MEGEELPIHDVSTTLNKATFFPKLNLLILRYYFEKSGGHAGYYKPTTRINYAKHILIFILCHLCLLHNPCQESETK